MTPILAVLATGIVAFAIVELVEQWRRHQTRKKERAASRR